MPRSRNHEAGVRLTAKDEASAPTKRAEGSFRRLGRFLSDRLVITFGDVTRAAAKLVRAFTSTIAAANEQEDAVTRLNAALAPLGGNAASVSTALQAQAAALQQVTSAGDEQIIQAQALLANLGVQAELLPTATRATLDLSAALGIDLGSAARNVGRTVGGFAGELGEVIPALKELTEEQLKAGQGIELLAEQFAGRAAAQAQTFRGQLAQLGNAFGDLQEQVGFTISRNEAIRASLARLTAVVQRIGPVVGQNLVVVFERAVAITEAYLGILVKLGGVLTRIRGFFEDWTGQIDATLVRQEALGASAARLGVSVGQLRAELGLATNAGELYDLAQQELEDQQEATKDSNEALGRSLGNLAAKTETAKDETQDATTATTDAKTATEAFNESLEREIDLQETLGVRTAATTRELERQQEVAAAGLRVDPGPFSFSGGTFRFVVDPNTGQLVNRRVLPNGRVIL